MNNKNINFLKEKAVFLKKKASRLFFIQTASFALLIIYGLGIVGLFSYYFVLKKESDALGEKVSEAKARIESLRSIETKQVYLKSKIKSLAEVLADQKQHQKITEAVFNFLPEGIAISGFAIDEKGGVSFSGESYSFKTLKNFFTSLETTPQIGEIKIKKVRIGKVSFDYEKGYSFDIYLLFEGLENV